MNRYASKMAHFITLVKRALYHFNEFEDHIKASPKWLMDSCHFNGIMVVSKNQIADPKRVLCRGISSNRIVDSIYRPRDIEIQCIIVPKIYGHYKYGLM